MDCRSHEKHEMKYPMNNNDFTVQEKLLSAKPSPTVSTGWRPVGYGGKPVHLLHPPSQMHSVIIGQNKSNKMGSVIIGWNKSNIYVILIVYQNT